MLGSLVLETAIGLVFVYLIFSLIASALAEYLSDILDRRGEHLKHLLLNVFDNDDPRGRTMLNLFVAHPMVQALSATEWKPTFQSAAARFGAGMTKFDRTQAKWDSAERSATAAAGARAEARAASAAAARAKAAVATLRAGASTVGRVELQTALDAAREAESAARVAQDAKAAAEVAAAVAKANRQAASAESASSGPSEPAAPAQSPAPRVAEPGRGSIPEQPAQEVASDLNPQQVAQRVTVAATAAAQAAREALEAADEAETATRGLDQVLVQSIVVPKYIPDRTFVEVLVHLLTAGSTLVELARDVAPSRNVVVPSIPLAAFWGRFTSALQIVRGIASRLPPASADSKTKIEEALSELQASVSSGGGGGPEASVIIGQLETGISALQVAVAAVPDDALRDELTRAVEQSLRPLHAVGQDILVLERIALATSRMADSSIKTALSASLQQAGEDLSAFKRSLATWFNEIMDHTSGWYKRNTQRILMVIALLLCTLNNVDTVAIVQHLTTDPKLRVEASEAAIASFGQGEVGSQAPSGTARLGGLGAKELEAALERAHLPLWWSNSEWNSLWSEPAARAESRSRFSPSVSRLLAKVTGLLLSIIAVSMGAPFWFEILNRLVNVRLAGPRPQPSVTSAPPGRTGSTP